jgi:hypothetical protein
MTYDSVGRGDWETYVMHRRRNYIERESWRSDLIIEKSEGGRGHDFPLGRLVLRHVFTPLLFHSLLERNGLGSYQNFVY